jgi:hypothetical protein
MLKDSAVFIGEGAHGKVYSNGDGTVTKVVKTDGKPYEELLPSLYYGRKNIEGVAKALAIKVDYHSANSGTIYIVKEELAKNAYVEMILDRIVQVWEDSLVNSNNLFDFIEQYLKGNQKTVFGQTRSVKEFIKILHLNSPLCIDIFFELIDIIEELKAEGIYNVDWNIENFGVRESTNKLTMFELGEARYKKKIV